MKKQQATEKRAAADQKQRDATAKRAAANSMKLNADAKKVQVQNTRNTMLGGITDVKLKKKAQLVVDAAIAGVNVTKVKASFIATSETAACKDAYLRMNLLSTLGVCDVNSTISDRRHRHLLADTMYLVEIMLSSAEVTQFDIDAALTTLAAAGVIAEISNEDSLVLLSNIPGIDTGIVKTFQNDLTAATTATAIAEAAETDAVSTESAAAILETDATAAEMVAVAIATEATNLDNMATAFATLVSPPSPPYPPPHIVPISASSSSSSLIAVIAGLTGALVGLGFLG